MTLAVRRLLVVVCEPAGASQAQPLERKQPSDNLDNLHNQIAKPNKLSPHSCMSESSRLTAPKLYLQQKTIFVVSTYFTVEQQ